MNTFYFDSVEKILLAIEKVIKKTEVVMDIGCGIMPMNYFRPKIHFLIEPWKQYYDILAYRHFGDKSIVIIRAFALDALRQFGDNSVDSIFLLDVIEHLKKEEGLQVIIECERVAREQIVIFTPLGFMAQHMDVDDSDGWGLDGGEVQEHLSGWVPEDFSSAWSFYICERFHGINFKGDNLKIPHGAFYAIRNFEGKSPLIPEALSDIRRPLPSEILVRDLSYQVQNITQALDNANWQYQNLVNSKSIKIILWLNNFLKKNGIIR